MMNGDDKDCVTAANELGKGVSFLLQRYIEKAEERRGTSKNFSDDYMKDFNDKTASCHLEDFAIHNPLKAVEPITEGNMFTKRLDGGSQRKMNSHDMTRFQLDVSQSGLRELDQNSSDHNIQPLNGPSGLVEVPIRNDSGLSKGSLRTAPSQDRSWAKYSICSSASDGGSPFSTSNVFKGQRHSEAIATLEVYEEVGLKFDVTTEHVIRGLERLEADRVR
ncbi:hypothetical protein V6N11_034350 [Hibiscus sabdariffa]|uniref:Uncharacterized protein n=2 Tax=Hibiscus sabdariffa TaxID=183260 RepID=A0ABR2D9T8_9ROSI